MLKHIITTRCFLPCTLPIKHLPEHVDIDELNRRYKVLAQDYSDILITGGEPTCHSQLDVISQTAKMYFNNVFLQTSNRLALADPKYNKYTAVWFSGFQFNFPLVLNGHPVFACINADQFCTRLPAYLKQRGYQGILIYPQGKAELELPQENDFEIKFLEEAQRVLLPSLKLLGSHKLKHEKQD